MQEGQLRVTECGWVSDEYSGRAFHHALSPCHATTPHALLGNLLKSPQLPRRRHPIPKSAPAAFPPPSPGCRRGQQTLHSATTKTCHCTDAHGALRHRPGPNLPLHSHGTYIANRRAIPLLQAGDRPVPGYAVLLTWRPSTERDPRLLLFEQEVLAESLVMPFRLTVRHSTFSKARSDGNPASSPPYCLLFTQ